MPEIWEREPWNPEAFWKVKVWNRIKYIIVQVQAGNSSLAKAIAISSLCRDGEIERNLSVIEVTRVE